MFTLTASLPVTVTVAVPMDATDAVARIRQAAAFVVAMSLVNPNGWTDDEYCEIVNAVCDREGKAFQRYAEQEVYADLDEIEYGRKVSYEIDDVEYGSPSPWARYAADALYEMAQG